MDWQQIFDGVHIYLIDIDTRIIPSMTTVSALLVMVLDIVVYIEFDEVSLHDTHVIIRPID